MAQNIWHKSSRSGNATAHCVEVTILPTGIGVRDSKDPDGPKLVFGTPGWQAFTGRIKTTGFPR